MLNDLFRTYKKMILLVLLIVSSIFFWFFGCHKTKEVKIVSQTFEKHPGKKNEGISYDFSSGKLSGNVVFGTKGYLVPNKSLPVVMNVTAKEKSFAGTLKITLPGEDGNGVSYQCALACPSYQSTTVETRIPALGNASYFNLEILDTYGSTELSTTVIPDDQERKIVEYADEGVMNPLLVGILSDSYKDFKTLDDMGIYPDHTEEDMAEFEGDIVKPIELRAKDLENPDFRLDALSIVIIDDFDTAVLSDTARNKLKDYVMQQGGNLLIGTGENGEKVLSGIHSLAGAEYDSQEEGYLMLPGSFDEDAGILLTRSVFVRNRKRDWDIAEEEDMVMCYGTHEGKGHILLSTIALSGQSITNWTEQEGLYSYYLEKCVNEADNRIKSEETSLWYMKSALYSFLSTSVPGTFGYGFFLLAYLAALGLFVYNLIKRSQKRENIWIGVPLLSLAFTMILVVRNMGSPSLGSTLSAINVTDRENKVSEVYCLYQNSEGSGVTIPMNQSVVNVEPIGYEYRIDESVTADRSINSSYVVNNTVNGYEIQFEDTVPGTSFMIKATADSDRAMTDVTNPEELSSGKFVVTTESDDNGFSGILINESGQSYDAVILANRNNYAVYKNVEAGKAIQITNDDIYECVDVFDNEEVEEGITEDNSALGNLINYACQKYCDESNGNQVVLVTLSSKDNIKLFETNNSIRNSFIMDVSRYPTEAK